MDRLPRASQGSTSLPRRDRDRDRDRDRNDRGRDSSSYRHRRSRSRSPEASSTRNTNYRRDRGPYPTRGGTINRGSVGGGVGRVSKGISRNSRSPGPSRSGRDMKAYDEHDRRGSGRSGRSRSRDRDRIRRDRDRHRSRSISREGAEIGGNRGAGKKGGERRARSVSRKEKLAAGDIDTPMLGTGDDEADEEAQMAAMMGFSGFGTTKQKKVQGNNVGAVAKHKTTEYRQYMNRPGGFNRALSPS